MEEKIKRKDAPVEEERKRKAVVLEDEDIEGDGEILGPGEVKGKKVIRRKPADPFMRPARKFAPVAPLAKRW